MTRRIIPLAPLAPLALALGLSQVACTWLTQPEEITITPDVLGAPEPAPAPAPPPVAPQRAAPAAPAPGGHAPSGG